MNRNFVAIAAILAGITVGVAPVAPTQAQTPNATQLSWVAPKQAIMRLTPTTRFTATGERILNLDLLLDGKLVDRVQAVSGRPGRQHFRLGPASQAGSREPLPQGTYQVGAVDRQGGLPAAMGDTFIPVTPLFATSRSGIGIHLDADRHLQGGSGTIGCLGVLDQADLDAVVRFVQTYRVRTLTVDYGLTPRTVAVRK
ncbi:MAG: hypothetical protein NW220_09955 [Leptolyngbyaceae cyanobacterium bins.349]|nr:hypothetical protein [Leptolyngbyaceae cyanobacterium bins.349]